MDIQGGAEQLPTSSENDLSELEIKILDFERQWWRYAGAKELLD